MSRAEVSRKKGRRSSGDLRQPSGSVRESLAGFAEETAGIDRGSPPD